MEREIDLKQISDGKRYSANDMVKTGCNDCAGCSQCCRGMGSSIILDPYDIYCLEAGLKITFEELMRNYIELNVVDGIILPNLKMQKKDCCGFWTKKEDAVSMISVRASAECSLWGGFMRTGTFSIFCRCMNARIRARRRLR